MTDTNIADQIEKIVLGMLSKLNEELTRTAKEVIAKNSIPWEEIEFHFETSIPSGVTTLLYNGKPFLKWEIPVVEVNEERTGYTYKWRIWKVKD